MAEVVTITGTTGSGKTHSLQYLNPKETFVASVVGRSLPFKGWKKNYNSENKNYAKTSSYQQVIKALNFVNNDKRFKVFILDDADMLMNKELFKRANETGYSKFTEIAKHMQELLEYMDTQLRDDLIVFIMFHEELILVDGYKPIRDIRLPGKMIKEKFNPYELVNISLFTEVEYDKNGDPQYYFLTKRSNKCENAKSPQDMFEDRLIPNNLQLVVDAIKNYEN